MVIYVLNNIFQTKFGFKSDEYFDDNLLTRIREKDNYIDILTNMSYDSKCMLLMRFKKELTDIELYQIFDNYKTEEFKKYYDFVCK